MKQNVKDTVSQILTNYLELNNRRKTPERYAILEAVYDMDGHFTLDELGEKLSEEDKFPVSRATLYNTLETFSRIASGGAPSLSGHHSLRGMLRQQRP